MHFHHMLPFLSTLISSVTSSPIEARTCPSTNIITDGGFESGVEPPDVLPLTPGGNFWTVTNFIGYFSYSLTSPGSPNAGGQYAFTVSIYPAPYGGTSSITLVQTMKTCAGQNYSVAADYKFSESQNNACSISVQYPFKDTVGSVTTGSGTPGLTPGVWNKAGGTFQAVSSADKLSFVFKCEGRGVRNVYNLDNVVDIEGVSPVDGPKKGGTEAVDVSGD
ncbi:MAG: hypothetical protein Q9193_001905 [Seirophora villosa]